jgi:hypothetical protein
METIDLYQEKKLECIFDRFLGITLEEAYYPPKPYHLNEKNSDLSK